MTDLADFLLARITEDEEVARRAGGQQWRHRSLMRHPTSRQSVYAEDREIAEVDHTDGEHIARHDPARVLAECEAKRRIVDAAARYIGDAALQPYELWTGGEAMELTLRLLALPYADHEAYREEWRP